MIPPSARTALASAGEVATARPARYPTGSRRVRLLRGSILFDNGRRRHFRTEEGRLFDADPIDRYSYHILAYDAMRLVGCVRVYRLVSNGPACVTEKIL